MLFTMPSPSPSRYRVLPGLHTVGGGRWGGAHVCARAVGPWGWGWGWFGVGWGGVGGTLGEREAVG